MPRLFGTDGVRGVAGTELDCQLAYNLGRAGAYILTEGTHKPKILVGRDTRISGEMLECALCAGICSVGATAVPLGVVPTPGVSYLTRAYGADAGIMISASHNPMEYNGIKFFNRDGFKLPDETEDQIQAIIENGFKDVPSPTGGKVGRVKHKTRAEEDYLSYLASLNNVDLTGLKVAIDCANGAVSHMAPRFLADLGVEVVSIYDQPNGRNINDNCGSTHMENICRIVKDTGSDIGLAFDGDADRMLAVDENGNMVDGDQIMAICARELMEKNQLAHDTLVVTVMSNLGLTIAAKKMGFRLEKTKVGDRYVLERMLKGGYVIGGEQSGHVIFSRDNTTGDGLLSAMRLLEALKTRGCLMSELAGIMKPLPQVLVNINISNDKKPLLDEDIEIQRAINRIEDSYDGNGRVLVRPSGTEPLVRVMIEGEHEEVIQKDANTLAELIAHRLG